MLTVETCTRVTTDIIGHGSNCSPKGWTEAGAGQHETKVHPHELTFTRDKSSLKGASA
jgi:hypothetical protein